MKQDIRKLVIDYLNEAELMQIATVRDNKPWVATVWFAYDKNMNFYFISRKTRRHSLELKDNPSVAGAIVKPHRTLGVKTRGIQFEGEASEVSLLELPNAFNLFVNRYPETKKFMKSVRDIVKNITDHHIYKIIPSMIVLFDEVNFPDNSRQELKL